MAAKFADEAAPRTKGARDSGDHQFRVSHPMQRGVGKDRIKRMTVDAFGQDSLSLNNRELATDSFKMTIQTVETDAISHNSSLADLGFVSSLRGDTRNGALVRRTGNSSIPQIR